MEHIDQFLARLTGVIETGTGWKACCPCSRHGRDGKDKKPSLSVSLGEDKKIILFCFAGCNTDDIIADMGLEYRDLRPKDEAEATVDSSANAADTAPVTYDRPRPADSIDAALHHSVYSVLQAKLTLSDTHRQNLRDRGLSDEQIDLRGYRSLSYFSVRQGLGALREQFGQALLQVPGFVHKDGKICAVEMPAGILIPIRDMQERIIALQVRCDENRGGGKYRWFSGGDTSSRSPAHVPLGVKPSDTIRVTEGGLKADIAFALDGVPTIGTGGVSAWDPAIPVLAQLGAKTVRVAFDADARDNFSVATAVTMFCTALSHQFEVQVEVWPLEKGKGIDDLLRSGGKPDLLSRGSSGHFLRSLNAGIKGGSALFTVEQVDPPAEFTSDEPEPITPEESTPCATPLSDSLVEASQAIAAPRGPDKFPYGSGDPAPFPLDFFPEPLQAVAKEIGIIRLERISSDEWRGS
ncbi:MAG: DUF3854 domain-containing protein [Planctomycetes bacterium]|nr:DUF3854 domain-containing protein [Planctomycetota bacterium]